MKAGIILLVYAAVLLIAGFYAFQAAPEGANAKTALIVPAIAAALCTLFAMMALAMKASRRVGMIGIHAGLALPLLFALAFGFRGYQATQAVSKHPAAMEEFRAAVEADPKLAEPARKKSFFRERGTSEHDTAYLRNTVWFLCGASVVAFVVMLGARPRPEKRG